MSCRLIALAAEDGWPLDGALYEAGDASGWAALLVHGKVMNFYTGPCRILPPALVALGCTCLAITAASWVDLSENVPLTVENARRYPGPLLALRGAREPQALYPAEAIVAAAGEHAKLAVIPEADHFYNGVEDAFAQAVVSWFRDAVAVPRPTR